MSLATLMGIDRERYDQGNKFLSQDPYLQNFQAKAPITFNVSPNTNTGIISAYNPYPVIPMYGSEGDGDRSGTFGGIDKGVTADASAIGGYNRNLDGSLFNDLEVEEEIAAARNRDRLSKAAQLGLFALNPAGYVIGKGIKGAYNFVKDKFFGGNDSNDGDGFDQDQYDAGKASAAAQEAANRDYARSGGESGAAKSTNDTRGGAPSHSTRDLMFYGGRVGYRDGGYSSEDNEEQQAQDQASFDAGNRTDAYNDMYSGDDSNPPPTYSNNEPPKSNLNFNLIKDIDPAFSYANRFGTLGGILDTTRTIQEEEPIGNIGYLDPSSTFGIGYDTDLGTVGNVNLGNLNIGYTGQGGFNANYMGGFAGDAGRFGANYNKDGFGLGLTYNKKFNNGGIVGLYR